MSNIRFYLWIFRRRLPWFLAVSIAVTGLVVALAWRIAPVYSSNLRMIIETPQIPASMAELTVSTPPEEHLERLQQALLARDSLLAIAKQFDLPPDKTDITDDKIAGWMAGHTKVVTESEKDKATIMNVSFEAPTPEAASGVLTEYMNLIQRANTDFRTARAAETMQFFKQEADQLGREVEEQGARVLEFKNAHAGELPDDLEYRMRMRTSFQERLIQVERNLTALYEQRRRSIDLYERTGRVRDTTIKGTPEEQELAALQSELAQALAVLAPSNPKVRNLRGRVEQMEKIVAQQAGEEGGDTPGTELDIELLGIDSEIAASESERADLDKQIQGLSGSIDRTSVTAVQLATLQRDYENVQKRYSAALERLGQANTGERIETLARGQAVLVTEAPETPTSPSRPNRKLMAVAGLLLGIMSGAVVVAFLEFLNNTVRRPEDLHKRLGVWPIATLPLIPARRG